MAYLGNSRVYAENFMMNANPVYLAWCLMVFAAFNGIFLTGFFKTGWKFGKPYIAFMTAAFMLVAAAEMLHHLPGLAFLNATADPSGDIWPKHWAIFAAGLAVYAAVTALSLKRAIKLFERVDL